jgi:hypothetical protein
MRKTTVPGAFFLMLALSLAAGCKEKDDEKLILALIERAAVLAQEHNASKIMKLATDTFLAYPGGRDAVETKQILLIAFMRYGKFQIKYPNPSIDIASTRDMANVKIPFVVIREGALLPDLGSLYEDPAGWLEEAGKTADPYHLELRLAKIKGDWLVERAEIQGIRPMEDI